MIWLVDYGNFCSLLTFLVNKMETDSFYQVQTLILQSIKQPTGKDTGVVALNCFVNSTGVRKYCKSTYLSRLIHAIVAT